jgi:hypothetical protein
VLGYSSSPQPAATSGLEVNHCHKPQGSPAKDLLWGKSPITSSHVQPTISL